MMTINNKFLAVIAAVVLAAAIAVPALAFENEFHGVYRAYLMESNFNNGYPPGAGLRQDAGSGFVAYQRARIMYTAKANDDLKLVTHFEMDSRFGGLNPKSASGGYKWIAGNNDSGQMDADSLTLETKNVYLDFNLYKTNVKIGIQPVRDSYQSIFFMADVAGVTVTKKFDALTLTGGWYRLEDLGENGNTNGVAAVPTALVGRLATDMIVIDGNYAVNKDISVGASYYNVQRDSAGFLYGSDQFELLHMVGVNAEIQVGPTNIKPFFAYQFGDGNPTGKVKNDISAFFAGLVTKTKAGPGNVNVSGFYTSGDKDGTGKNTDFKGLGAYTEFFGPANMWLLLRHNAGFAEQTVISCDNTARGRGLMGIFAGYEGKADRFFYSGNVGYMRTAQQRTSTVAGVAVKENATVGTEINGMVGYQLFANMSVTFNVAYAFLGDGLNGSDGKRIANFGTYGASDPYLVAVGLSYVF